MIGSDDPMDLVLVERVAPAILLVTLNHPDRRDALSKDLLRQFVTCLQRSAADESVGCIVLTGSGDVFATSEDVQERTTGSAETDPERLALWQAIEAWPKPLIAGVNGEALGSGLELMLLCDVVIAAERARFGCPGIREGSIPSDGATQRLPRLVGKSFAMQMILTGNTVGADVAEQKGLVNEVVENGRLLSRALELATEIASMPVAVIPYAKRAINASFELALETGLTLERKLAVATSGLRERGRGRVGVIELRPPLFRGR